MLVFKAVNGQTPAIPSLIRRGFSLVINVLNVSRFGQKCLLHALNVNVSDGWLAQAKRRIFIQETAVHVQCEGGRQ